MLWINEPCLQQLGHLFVGQAGLIEKHAHESDRMPPVGKKLTDEEKKLIRDWILGAKDGRLAFIELRHSSGTAILDDAALTAVKLAQPFPPVPDDIAKQTLAINGQFRYQIVSGFVNQFLR